MKKSLLFFCAAIASIATILYSCSEDVAESIKGSIVGTVSDDTTGELISVAKVLLKPSNKSTVTGSDGIFEFSELDAGKYTVEITKTGYKTNTTEITVSDGQTTDAHILMERIPAIITADKEVLDFGTNSTVTSLSFNIVNKSYKALDWSVDCTCAWVSSIEPKTSGKLDYGKTATLIVKIDRNKLESGYNESYLVVFSEEGSVEVKLTAVGAETAVPVLNILEASDVKSSSVRLNAKIINPGTPEYTKRGFVYGVSANPTVDNVVLQAEYDDKAEFSCEATNLTLGTTYYARAYAINKMKGEEVVTYSANSIQVVTKASSPKVSIAEVTGWDFEKKTAVLNGVIEEKGDPSYSEKGFVYGTTNNPTIESNIKKLNVEGTTSGEYSALATGLELNVKYYVRAYAINEAGTVYSEKEEPFSLVMTPPSVEIMEISESDKDISRRSVKFNANITEEGIPSYTERGFVYGDKTSPTIYDNIITVDGRNSEFSAPANNLELDKVYFVRAYIKNEYDTYYSDNKDFVLTTTPPQVKMVGVTDKSYSAKRAKFTGKIEAPGNPSYSQRGFVYGLNSNPTIGNDLSVTFSGGDAAEFSISVPNLTTGQKYFVRVFVEQNKKYFYSDELDFTLTPTPASVEMVVVDEVTRNSAKVTSNITCVGDPEYIERGFVYNVDGNPNLGQTIDKVIVSGNGDGSFSARLTGLASNTTYYTRAYVIQNGQEYYSTENHFTTDKQAAMVSTNEATNVMFTTATLNATITNVGDPIYNRRGFYYGTTSNPTSANSTTIVENENSFGAYSKDLTGLQEKTMYYYRAFLIQPGETSPILGEVKHFTTGHAPNVTTGGVINVSCAGTEEANLNWSATLYGGVSDEGNPAFTEFGFVYGTTSQPKVDDGHSIYTTTTTYELQNSTKMFSKTISGLTTGTTYYIRSVAKTPLGYVYGEPIVFTPAVIAPTVRTGKAKCYYANDTYGWVVELYGVAATSSQPPITGLGFVYGTKNTPTIGDESSIVVSYKAIEKQDNVYVYGAGETGLQPNQIYYVRTYAKTALGYTYGEVLSFWTY